MSVASVGQSEGAGGSTALKGEVAPQAFGQKLRESRDFAEAVVWEAPPLLILGSDLRVRCANRAFCRTFGVTASQIEGCSVYDVGGGQWNIPALRSLLEETIPRSQSVEDYEVTHDFEGVGRRTLLLNARQLGDQETIILWISDITGRKQAESLALEAREAALYASDLEKTVAQRTASLREIVRELEAFSYSMVHDMRTPLRAINSFARLVHEDYGGRLDERGRNYLERIFSAADRLDQLIEDVLNYTRVLRDQAPLTRVNLGELMGELLATNPDWTSAEAEIQIEEQLPVVLGHKALLAQCFSNLVRNALKFVAPGTRPHVRVWAESRDDLARIHVQDNGIGIAPEHRARLFGIFHRIHPASEYEGTGIGLAIVRRAVERMRGRVDFESEVGQGTTFWIELPRGDKP